MFMKVSLNLMLILFFGLFNDAFAVTNCKISLYKNEGTENRSFLKEIGTSKLIMVDLGIASHFATFDFDEDSRHFSIDVTGNIMNVPHYPNSSSISFVDEYTSEVLLEINTQNVIGTTVASDKKYVGALNCFEF